MDPVHMEVKTSMAHLKLPQYLEAGEIKNNATELWFSLPEGLPVSKEFLL